MPRIVGLVESAEVQQGLTEQEEGVMCGRGQTSRDCFCPFFRENLLSGDRTMAVGSAMAAPLFVPMISYS